MWISLVWDVNDLCGWAMSQRLPVNGFESAEVISEFHGFLKSCNENDERYFLEVNIQYAGLNLHKTQGDLPFISQRMKIKKSKSLL